MGQWQMIGGATGQIRTRVSKAIGATIVGLAPGILSRSLTVLLIGGACGCLVGSLMILRARPRVVVTLTSEKLMLSWNGLLEELPLKSIAVQERRTELETSLRVSHQARDWLLFARTPQDHVALLKALGSAGVRVT